MKIVIISPFQFNLRRGIERYTFSLANQFAREFDIQIIIYTWKSKNNIEWGRWHDNILIRRVPYSRYYQQFLAQFWYNLWIRIDKPKKVMLNFLYHGEISLPKNLDYYYVLHSPRSQIPERYDFISKHIIKYKKLQFIAVSNTVENEARKVLKYNSIMVIHNGVDINYFTPKSSYADKRTLNLITLSALEERKGIQYIINALAFINDNSITYTVYGDGPYEHRLQELIRANKLTNCIKILPSSDNVNELLNEADVFCLLSKGEAFPLGPLEAMSCGLPVLVSNYPPYNEFVGSDVGIQVNRDSIDEIRSALSQFKSAKTRKKMGSSGRNFVVTEYSWEKVSNQYYNYMFTG